ncbi:hypothetical protein Tco_1491733 [Tanacetum coccineum]
MVAVLMKNSLKPFNTAKLVNTAHPKSTVNSAKPMPHIDLSNSSLEEFQQPEFKGFGPKASKNVCLDTSNEVKKTPDTPLVEELVLEKGKQTVFPTKTEFVKQQDKTARKPVKYAEMYRSQKPRGNQRNWNNLKFQQIGSNFVMYNKACFVCGSFDHVQAHCKYLQRERMVYGNNYNRVNYNYTTNRTHPNAQRKRAVLIKTGLKSFNTARTVNTAHPKSIVFSAKPISCFSKSIISIVKRPYQSKIVLTNKRFTQKVNTTKAKAVNIARPKVVNTARPHSAVVNVVRANQENAIKASIQVRYVIFSGGVRGGKIIGSEVSIGEGSTSKETDTSQDYIVMPLWKDSSLFDSSSMNTSHDEPEPPSNAKKKDDEGVVYIFILLVQQLLPLGQISLKLSQTYFH